MCYTHLHVHACTHTHVHTLKYYSDIKKDEIWPFITTLMGLEDVLLIEINQTEKDKYHIIALVCGI